jgi:16S rRNA (cytosine967-C5)-methyltransferase
VRVADLGWEALGRPTEGWTALDACAAPGGKSFRLATRGAAVTAVDAQARRLQKVGEGARRLGLPVQEAVHDWLRGPCATLGLYDLVLVDAPCTGLGTLRRHPEIKWRRLRSDPAAMAIRQVPILQAAAAHVRPGGVVVYAVCSPEPEEGIRVVEALQGWSIERSLRFAPPAGDEDAFQAFLLRKAG